MDATYSNLLIDDPPQTVRICGTERKINSNFRTAILFEILMDDNTVDDKNKGIQALKLFFPELPRTEKEVTESVEKMLWFYRCGKEPNEYMRQKEKKMQESEKTESRIYDFNYDDDYIYAAFTQQYGINLSAIQYMHWWEFRALFKSLTNQTEFVKNHGIPGNGNYKRYDRQRKELLQKDEIRLCPPSSERRERADGFYCCRPYG